MMLVKRDVLVALTMLVLFACGMPQTSRLGGIVDNGNRPTTEGGSKQTPDSAPSQSPEPTPANGNSNMFATTDILDSAYKVAIPGSYVLTSRTSQQDEFVSTLDSKKLRFARIDSLCDLKTQIMISNNSFTAYECTKGVIEVTEGNTPVIRITHELSNGEIIVLLNGLQRNIQ